MENRIGLGKNTRLRIEKKNKPQESGVKSRTANGVGEIRKLKQSLIGQRGARRTGGDKKKSGETA